MGNNRVNNRLRFIDIAKGIAIISVILGHFGSYEINRVVFTFHVPLFFMITGYFLNDKRSISEFVKNKFRSLIVPYIATCIVVIVVGSFEGMILGDAKKAFIDWIYASFYGAGDTYDSPFYIKGIGAIWFLLATFWGSIFLRFLLRFPVVFRVILIVVLAIFGIWSKEIFWFPFSIQAGALATGFMYLGYLIQFFQDRIQNIAKGVKIVGIFIAIVLWGDFILEFQSFWLVHCDIGRGIFDVVCCICACSMVMFISYLIDRKLPRISEILSKYGKYSLILLCVHEIELNLFPWNDFVEKVVMFGLPEAGKLVFLIVAKLVADTLAVYVLLKCKFVRKIFGYEY